MIQAIKTLQENYEMSIMLCKRYRKWANEENRHLYFIRANKYLQLAKEYKQAIKILSSFLTKQINVVNNIFIDYNKKSIASKIEALTYLELTHDVLIENNFLEDKFEPIVNYIIDAKEELVELM